MVVTDKLDYLNKVQDLLGDKDTYRPIPGDSTNKQRNKHIQTLRNIKAQGGLNDYTYKRMNQFCYPQVLWSLQNPQTRHLCRPIVSSREKVTYGMAKESASIIGPLVGQSPHHILNTQHFVEQIKSLLLQQGECMVSYNEKALFTSFPVDCLIFIVKSNY